jgi:hypothetical protein
MIQGPIEIETDLVRPKREVARQLDCCERNVDRFIADGLLPVVEVSPRRVGVLQSDIDAFKRSRRVFRGVQAAA